MELKAGMKLRSSVCTTNVIAIKGSGEVALTCGGAAMTTADAAPTGEIDQAFVAGTLAGKRYQTEDGSIELLCTKAGTGTLAINGTALAIKTAKPLPSSD